MLKKRFQFQISIALILSLFTGLAYFATTARGAARQPRRDVQLTLLPDFFNNQVMVVGMVSSSTTMTVEEAQMSDWGITGDLQVWPNDSGGSGQGYYFQGIWTNAHLQAPEEAGPYSISLGPLKLAPGDTVSLTIPFSSLVLGNISPEPENLDEVKNPILPLTYLRYSATESSRDLVLEIPFIPIKKEITLNLFPLVGEMLLERENSYRLFGQVIFKDIRDFSVFKKYCQMTGENPFWPYRMADTLFALDYLPLFHFGYLPPVYQYKPSYLLVRNDLETCNYENGVGEVATKINGRVFSQEADLDRFPEFLLEQDVTEQHIEIQGRDGGTGVYEMQLGSIFLGPGDVLKVALPGSDMRSISPAPSRFSFTKTGQTLAEFDGPGKFILRVRYSPQPKLFVQQLPAMIRALGSSAEGALSSLAIGSTAWQPWAVLILSIAALAGVQRLGKRIKFWSRAAVWFAAGTLCYYSFQHVYGLILFATGVHFLSAWNERSKNAMARSLLILLIAAVFMLLDRKAMGLIFMLDGFDLELTQFTPTLLLIFGFSIILIYRKNTEKIKWTPQAILAPALFLLALSTLDALQKSLPALLLAGGLIIILARRFNSLPPKTDTDTIPDVPARFRAVWNSKFVLTGLLALTMFVVANDVTTTTEVLAPNLGVIRFLLAPILLAFSAALTFLATGALFLLLYPALPFKEGYLKAITFTLGLCSFFVLGIGSDDRLVIALPTMLVGRFIYYLGAPLLIGIFMDADIQGEKEKAEGESDKPAGDEMEWKKTYDQLKNRLRPLGSLLSLVAPALYAWVSDQPLVTSYFDVLEAVISFTLG